MSDAFYIRRLNEAGSTFSIKSEEISPATAHEYLALSGDHERQAAQLDPPVGIMT